jgi:hypothetical protein
MNTEEVSGSSGPRSSNCKHPLRDVDDIRIRICIVKDGILDGSDWENEMSIQMPLGAASMSADSPRNLPT